MENFWRSKITSLLLAPLVLLTPAPLLGATRIEQPSSVGANPNLAACEGEIRTIVSPQGGAPPPMLLLDRSRPNTTADDHGKTALMHAVSVRSTKQQLAESVRSLIEAGADANARDKNGRSVAQLAIAVGNTGILPLLIDHGARLSRKEMFEAAAEYAERNRFDDVQKLLLNGDDPDSRDNNGQTALMRMAERGQAGMAKVLLCIGSEPDLKDNSGMTALMHAARSRRTDLVNLLLKAGADPNMKDKKGNTALILIIPSIWTALNPGAYWRENSTETLNTAQTLLENGADPNATDADGLTPLILASGRGQAVIVRLLLAHGADLNARGPYGITAYQVAAGPEVIEILKKARSAKQTMPGLKDLQAQDI